MSTAAISGLIALLGLAFSVAGSLMATTRKRARADERCEQHGRDINDHEARLRVVESTCTGTRSDVKWIREAIERVWP